MLQDLRLPSPYKQNSDGLHFLYDATRGLWLSVERNRYTFILDSNRARPERWLWIDNLPSNLGGSIVERQSRITQIIFNSKDTSNGTIKLCDTDENPIYDLTVENETLKTIPGLDILLPKNTPIAALLSDGEFSYPRFTIELAAEYI